MKRVSKFLAMLVLALILLTALPLKADAAEACTINGTVDKYMEFVFFYDDQDIVESVTSTGHVPGMNVVFFGDGGVALEGVPTIAGTYLIEVTVYTQRTSGYNFVLTVTIREKSADGTPVVTKHPTGETLVEGESATFIAKADNVRQYVWEIGIADACIDVEILPNYIGKGVKVSGWDTERLVIENIPIELDGAHVWCRFVGAEESVTSDSAILKVISLENAIPVVTKHPTSETVEAGGEAVFVAKAKYVQIYTWQLISPEDVVFDCETIQLSFPELKVSGAKTERLTLSNIPLELNGYRVRCMFTAGDAVTSDFAKLTVTEKATEPATEPTTEAPTETTTEPSESQSKTEDPGQANTNGTVPGESVSASAAEQPVKDDGDGDGGGNTLLIVAILSAAAVAIVGIAGYTVLKLKKM